MMKKKLFSLNNRAFILHLTLACPLLLLTMFVAEVVANKATSHQLFIEQTEPSGAKESERWQEIKLDRLSFSAPRELKRVTAVAYDVGYYEYKSENLVLDMALGLNAFGPGLEQKYPNYSHESLTIDGATVWIWFYEKEEGEFKYHAGGRFTYKDADYAVTITLHSKNQNLQETAKKIFMSVKLKRAANS